MELEKNKFESWLRSQHGNSIVGIPRSGTNCPLANFIVDEFEKVYAAQARINDFVVYTAEGSKKNKMPTWGNKFIKAIDAKPSGSITVAKALELL